MNSTLEAVLQSWPFDPWLLAALIASGAVYWRGWRTLRRGNALRWSRRQLVAFLGGLVTVDLALASPIETFSTFFLCVHMTQHMLLMMVAAPLVWLGAPLFPLLRGLPLPIRTYWVAPMLRSRGLRRLLTLAGHPLCALPIFIAVTWLWHAPVTYQAALRSSPWHYLQHVSFLGAALLFWYSVIRPYPARPKWSLWLLFPYLFAAEVQNTLLSALLTFSSRPLYAHYVETPRLSNLSAIEDQSIAGAIMWVAGSLAFLGPLFWIGLRLLYGSRAAPELSRPLPSRKSLPALLRPKTRTFDLLNVPVVGRFLRWKRARLALQLLLSIAAVAIIFDGLFGPRLAPMNLAGVVPWIHWRGLIVIGLLAVGNVFCMGCPFTLPRTLARWFLPAGRSWPRRLQNKWLAVLLLGLFLWSYEAFSLWNSPRWTAWIAAGYFVLAFAVDGIFRGASFCKYVCPIGQFNFVQSLVSPMEVKVREPDVCSKCTTHECIRGNSAGVPGCELQIFQPRKQGNMDCTFCLDCVHACPHGNVGILAALPAKGLWRDSFRSGVGRLSERTDLAALVLILVFGAFANAAGMVGPIVNWEKQLTARLGLHSSLPVISLFYVFALIVLPLAVVGSAAMFGRWWSRDAAAWRAVATRYAYALVPLGFGMWFAHYSFHFFTSCGTIVPTTQRFLAEHFGWSALGAPIWACSCCGTVADWIPRIEILSLGVGMLLSQYVVHRIALEHCVELRRAMRSMLPWMMVTTLLYAAGVWIVLQPMQMRGTM